MLNFLRSNNPIYFFLSTAILPIIALLYYVNSSSFLWPIESFFQLNPTILYGLYIFTVFFTALRINLIINKSVFFQKSNYASGVIYIVLIGVFGNIHSSLNPLLGNLFLVLAIENLFKIFRNKSCKIEVFNASCWLIISCLFYWLNIFLLPVLWLALYFIRPFQWREYIMPLIALVFLGAFFFPFSLISDGFYSVFNEWLGISWAASYPRAINWGYISFAVLVGLLICFSSLVYTFIKSTNRYKKISWIVVSLLALTFAQFLFIKFVLNIDYPLFFILAMPFSILLSNAVLNSKYPLLIDSYLILFILGKILIEYVF
ncbi:MAG: hypothetical protein P8I02_02615 [Flavobacteriales bacterium]|nr:hypothetical protein [Flavobacteriales bacterium]